MHKKINSTSYLAICLSTFIVVSVLWFAFSHSEDDATSVADENSSGLSSYETGVEEEVQENNPQENLLSSRERSSPQNSRRGESTDSGQIVQQVNIMKEIAARISEGQLKESENELNSLIKIIDSKTDAEKYVFLEYFIYYSNNNAFNPEVVTAFDTLWSRLTLDLQTKLESAKLLASHYANSYEFVYAIDQFDILAELGATFDAELHRDLAYAQFSLHEYVESIPNLLAHIDLQTGRGEKVNRREYAMLFESYYRTGNIADAELVGNLIIDHYNDIQDWKDMQKFYEATGNVPGLTALRSRAGDLGLLNTNGDCRN